MFLSKKNKYQASLAGFTLIEVLVTLVIFSIGLLAIYNLSLANLNSTRDNFRRTLAVNLGREAIELIRNQRDNNWLAIGANQDCDAFDVSPDSFAICTWDYRLTDNFVTVSYERLKPQALVCADFDDCLTLNESNIYWYKQADGQHYTHTATNAINLDLKRVVGLQAICRDVNTNLVNGLEDISVDATCNNPTDTKIGVQVTVRLQWYFLGKIRSLDMVEKIYNWR